MPPARPSSQPPRAVALTVLAVVVAIVVGVVVALLVSSGGSPPRGTSADPSRAVPASAVLYVGADVRPSGEKGTAALAAGRALTHQSDPYMRLLAALQTPGSPVPDFSREVAPWLGKKAGIFLSSARSAGSLLTLVQQGLLGQSSAAGAFPFGSAGAQGAIVLDTRDMHRAQAFVQSAAARAGARATSYRGVPYWLSSGGVAFGLVHRFAVIGSDSGLRSVIDTTLGGPSLAKAPEYSALLAFAPSKGVAHVYANTSAAPPGAAAGIAGLLALFSAGSHVNVSLVPTPSSFALDVDSLVPGSPSTQPVASFASESARAFGELPADSWFAVGLGDISHTLAADVGGLRAIGSLASSSGPHSAGTGLNLKSLLEGLTTPLSVLAENTPQARRAFQSWMGSAGMFAAGTSLLELKAAVVISSKNPAGSRAAVGTLAAQLRSRGAIVQTASVPGTEAAASARLTGLPVALVIASGRSSSGQSKFVIGLGEPSVAAALSPPALLASAPSASAAASELGEGTQPSVMLEVPTLLGMLEGIGLAEDPSISPFVPYLRAVTTVVGGGHPLDSTVHRFRLVVGLRPAS